MNRKIVKDEHGNLLFISSNSAETMHLIGIYNILPLSQIREIYLVGTFKDRIETMLEINHWIMEDI